MLGRSSQWSPGLAATFHLPCPGCFSSRPGYCQCNIAAIPNHKWKPFVLFMYLYSSFCSLVSPVKISGSYWSKFPWLSNVSICLHMFYYVFMIPSPFRFASWAVAPPPWHRPMMQWHRCRVEPCPSLPAPHSAVKAKRSAAKWLNRSKQDMFEDFLSYGDSLVIQVSPAPDISR